MPEVLRASPAFLSSRTTDSKHRTEEVSLDNALIELTALDEASAIAVESDGRNSPGDGPQFPASSNPTTRDLHGFAHCQGVYVAHPSSTEWAARKWYRYVAGKGPCRSATNTWVPALRLRARINPF
jgi:hypothetical protein